jgi:hypothetical protein
MSGVWRFVTGGWREEVDSRKFKVESNKECLPGGNADWVSAVGSLPIGKFGHAARPG